MRKRDRISMLAERYAELDDNLAHHIESHHVPPVSTKEEEQPFDFVPELL